jgi:hypothetical protein
MDSCFPHALQTCISIPTARLPMRQFLALRKQGKSIAETH